MKRPALPAAVLEALAASRPSSPAIAPAKPNTKGGARKPEGDGVLRRVAPPFVPARGGRRPGANRHVPGVMNSTERAYAADLDLRTAAGDVAWYGFEVLSLKIAEATRYVPDFLVLLGTGELEVHEVKGHWEDDARVKIKAAAMLFPFRFLAARPRRKRDGGGWDFEEFPKVKTKR